ncbi:DUF262 domain-containing protein [Methanoregula sp.]|uniref:DUF262 domain-containing protein n=1 Tax=Methanoregula sp. TaxID=2052170 RepID=UPI003564DB6C
MVKQITSSPSTQKISDLYPKIQNQPPTLILQPDFQRRLVWNKRHKEKFIDTILQGLPVPEIYIAQSGIDLETIATQHVVVDGQQRLRTIVQYIENSDDFGKLVPKYKDLPPEQQREFLSYDVVVRNLGDLDSDTIRDVFKRINSTQFSLNQIELHNAVYDGDFITTAMEILTEIGDGRFPFLNEANISRMEDLHFILLIMATIENKGYFKMSDMIEKCIIEYNDTYPGAKTIKEKFIKIFEIIEGLKLADDSIWYRKSNFFTLFVELFNYGKKINIDKLKQKLEKFEEDVLINKKISGPANDYQTYYSYLWSGTNSRVARVSRSEIFNKLILSKI